MAFTVSAPLSQLRAGSSLQRRFLSSVHTRRTRLRACSIPSRQPSIFAQVKNENPPREIAATDEVTAFFLAHGVSEDASSRALARAPSLERAGNLESRAYPVLQALRDLGLSEKQISRSLTHLPEVILHNPSEFVPRLNFLRENANIPLDKLPGVIARCPHILIMNLDRANAVLDTVTDACGGTLTSFKLSNLLGRVAQIFVRPLSKVKRNITWLRSEAGLDQPNMLAKVLYKVPLTLVYDIERNLAVRISCFKAVNVPVSTIGHVVTATPEIFSWNVEKELKARIDSIVQIVGKENISGVLGKVPSILDSEPAERVEWLKEIGLNDAQILEVVSKAPAILSYSPSNNLAPKWAFVKGTMGGTLEDLVEAPREILCANLQQRAVPRYAFLASNDLVESVRVVDILRNTDAKFCSDIAKCEYSAYREYVDTDRYLLFYSQLL